MNDFHKELLTEIINDWTTEQLQNYITLLDQRALDLNSWISHLKLIRRKKSRKPVVDTGTRGGLG